MPGGTTRGADEAVEVVEPLRTIGEGAREEGPCNMEGTVNFFSRNKVHKDNQAANVVEIKNCIYLQLMK